MEENDLRDTVGISPATARRFAKEYITLLQSEAPNESMAQRHLVRHLLDGHLLSEQPNPADNKWRIMCRPPPPTTMWSALPLLGRRVELVELKPLSHLDTLSSSFWLLATGFKLVHRNILDSLVQSPDGHTFCPYLSIQYCDRECDMDDALDHLVMTGSLALYDRLLLRKAAVTAKRRAGAGDEHLVGQSSPGTENSPVAITDADDIFYYGITLSPTCYCVYHIAPTGFASSYSTDHKQQGHFLHPAARPLLTGRGARQVSTSYPKTLGNRFVGVGSDANDAPLVEPKCKDDIPGSKSIPSEPPRRPGDAWRGCEVSALARGHCLNVEALEELVGWLNAIHAWALGAHAEAVTADLGAIAAELGHAVTR